jgi:AcrR family transcriptional regulator
MFDINKKENLNVTMPKVVDHDQYRRTLLQQSLDLFAENGYSSITMRQLAEGLGVSTGTLYHYFPSKENMFLQLVEELTEQDISYFLAQAPTPPSRLERLEAVMGFVVDNFEYFTKQQLLWIDFYQHSHRTNLDLPAILDRIWNKTRQALADYLQTQDLEILDFILIFMDGLLMQQIYGKEEANWVKVQVALLCQMVATQLDASSVMV